MPHPAWDDTERHFVMVTGVQQSGDGFEVETEQAKRWQPGVDRGATCFMTSDAAPEPGEVVVMWGQPGLGGLFRGMARLDGTVLYYISAEDMESKHQAWRDESRRKQEARFIANKAEMEQQILTLPGVLQRRLAILRARETKPEYEWLDYEVFVLSQGAMIAATFPTVEAIEAFKEMPWENQRAALSELSDQHSGFTFGAACNMAYHLVTNPEALLPTGD